eukprot:CAMPEP_0185023592 /NCGR_PEP_ID=MMETSP1103-20130426/6245_1 /TAXON_ID=36769 /ORGANISM="Paraphysomonas bandaiensis, Strain Caron Lab Isolate" /LENGTH=666 /DNA_ID=CAMNT_0027556259 /DNA_START=44 /DNA_END=2041 /DNA_ORIENTATION=-
MEEESSSNPRMGHITLHIHKTITTLQNENGLKHHDHMRYSSFLTRKLQRVRKSIGFTYGRGKGFESREIVPEIITSEAYLLVPLLAAERAWSTAAAKKDALSKVGKMKLKHTEMRRRSKAAKWAETLETLCAAVGDAHTALEATAYARWMVGQDLLEREQWTEAMNNFIKAKAIYAELCTVGTVDERDIFNERQGQVEPAIRFCKYNLSGSGAGGTGEEEETALLSVLSSDPDLLEKLESMRARQSAERSRSADGEDLYGPLGNVVWCGRRVAVPPATSNASGSSVHALCAKAKSALDLFRAQDSTNKQPQTYAHCLSALDDARAGVLKLLSGEVANDGDSSRSKASLQHLEAYLRFTRLSCQSVKALKTIEGLDESAAQERAHLYEQLLAIVQEMKTVVEGAADGIGATVQSTVAEAEEEEDVLRLQLKADEAVFRTLRVVHLADCYASYAGQKKENSLAEGPGDGLAQAAALLEHADGLLGSVVYNCMDDYAEAVRHSTGESRHLKDLQGKVAELENLVAGGRSRIAALNTLQTSEMGSGRDSGWIDLEEAFLASCSLEESEDNKTLKKGKKDKKGKASVSAAARGLQGAHNSGLVVQNIPPGFAPIPCKPVFYDIALNYLEADAGDILDVRCGFKQKNEAESDGVQTSAGLVGAAQMECRHQR